MNDDIKKILDSIKYHIEEDDWFEIEGRFLKPLLDYITNLQQKLENKCWDEAIIRADVLLEQQDYKSRIEKAVEYNQQVIKDTKDFYRPTEDIIYSGDTLIDIAEQNINILNGRSDE
jgi:hypothetical protein